jgi:hypothetical protein
MPDETNNQQMQTAEVLETELRRQLLDNHDWVVGIPKVVGR